MQINELEKKIRYDSTRKKKIQEKFQKAQNHLKSTNSERRKLSNEEIKMTQDLPKLKNEQAEKKVFLPGSLWQKR